MVCEAPQCNLTFEFTPNFLKIQHVISSGRYHKLLDVLLGFY